MRGSGQGLMQQVASLTVAAQVTRTSQTVGTRFRDQLKDLITRLDQYAALPCLTCPACPCLGPCPSPAWPVLPEALTFVPYPTAALLPTS